MILLGFILIFITSTDAFFCSLLCAHSCSGCSGSSRLGCGLGSSSYGVGCGSYYGTACGGGCSGGGFSSNCVSGAAGCSGSCLPAAGPCPAPNVCPTYPPCPVGGGSYGGVGGASQTIFLEYAQPRAIAAGAPTLNTSAKAAMRGNPVMKLHQNTSPSGQPQLYYVLETQPAASSAQERLQPLQQMLQTSQPPQPLDLQSLQKMFLPQSQRQQSMNPQALNRQLMEQPGQQIEYQPSTQQNLFSHGNQRDSNTFYIQPESNGFDGLLSNTFPVPANAQDVISYSPQRNKKQAPKTSDWGEPFKTMTEKEAIEAIEKLAEQEELHNYATKINGVAGTTYFTRPVITNRRVRRAIRPISGERGTAEEQLFFNQEVEGSTTTTSFPPVPQQTHSVTVIHEAIDPKKCNSLELHDLMAENMSLSVSATKRAINEVAEKTFGGVVDVICSRGHFSYVFSSNLFCEVTKNGMTCIAFRQASSSSEEL